VIIDALKTAAGKISGQNGAAECLGPKQQTLQKKKRKLNISKADYSGQLNRPASGRLAPDPSRLVTAHPITHVPGLRGRPGLLNEKRQSTTPQIY
jgi:hypothetical protein